MKQSTIFGQLTLFDVEDPNTQLEFDRTRKQLKVPVGGCIKFKGDHTKLPFGFLSLNSDLKLSKGDYQNLYLVLKGQTGVTETTNEFTISADSGFIIRVT